MLLSGTSGLVDEVVWERLLGRAFGATAPATSTVLAVFMAGLGLGALIAGTRSERASRATCLRWYVWAELGVALLALASPAALARTADAYALIARSLGFGFAARFSSRAALCLIVLLPATMLMGATLPMLVRVAARDRDDGRTIGGLYAANTLGAMTGALLAGFALLPQLGERRTLLVAVSGNVLAAVVAFSALGATAPSTRATAKAPAPDKPRDVLALANAAACGLTMLGYEVLWTRTLGMALGASVYAFATILAAVLAGLALGAAVASRITERVRNPSVAFAGLGALSALSALALFRGLPTVVHWSLGLLDHPGGPAYRLALLPALVVAPLVVLPAALSGAAFPLGVRAAGTGGAAASTGQMYAANTAGSIVGALLAGFVLLPFTGASGTAIALAGVGVAGAALLWWRETTGRVRSIAAGVVFAWATLALSQPTLDSRIFGAGLHMLGARMRHVVVREGLEARLDGGRVLFARDDANTTVVVERWQGVRTFYVGGKPEASDMPLDARNQLLLGHLPALLHGSPRRGLVVGLGSGMTAGSLALHMRVDVAELSPAVRDAARHFADWNHHVADDPAVRILFEDGRTVLRARTDRYDVITVDPIHPYVAGASALYTRDYFVLVRARLNPHGVAAHWLPLYQLGWNDVAGVLRSFVEVFPDATVYLTGGDAILIGGAGPVLPSASRIAVGFDRPEVRADLARVWLDTAERVVALANCGSTTVRRLTRGARVITDDQMWIEFTAPRWEQTVASGNVERLLDAREPAPAGASVRELSARRSAEVVARSYSESWRTTQGARALGALDAALRDDPEATELRLSVDVLRRSVERGGR